MIKIVLAFGVLLFSYNVFSSTFEMEKPIVDGIGDDFTPIIVNTITSSLSKAGYKLVENNGDCKLSVLLKKENDLYSLSLISTCASIKKDAISTFEEIAQLDDVTKKLVKRVLPQIDDAQKNHWMFGIGPAWYQDLDTTHAKSVILGYSWEQSEQLDFQLKYEFSYANSNDFSTRSDLILVGGNYYFGHFKHAPYVSADMGFGSIKTNSNDATGWSIGGAMGCQLYKSSLINFSVEIKESFFDSKIMGVRPSVTTLRFILNF